MNNIFELYRSQNDKITTMQTSDNKSPRLPPAVHSRINCSSILSPTTYSKNARGKINSPSDVKLSHENDSHEPVNEAIKKIRGESNEGNDMKGTIVRETSVEGNTVKMKGIEVHTKGHCDRNPVFYSEELNNLLSSSLPITVIDHIALPNDTPTITQKDEFQRYLCDPMQRINTINARIALQAYASDLIHSDTILNVHKIRSSSTTSPEMAVTKVRAATSKATPPSHAKRVNRVASADGKRYVKRKEGESEMVSIPPRRRSAPKTFSPAPYLSSYKSTDEVQSKKRKVLDISTSTSSSSSSSDSGARNDSAAARSPTLEDSEDDVVVEAEILSIEEKKLLVEVLNLCRNHVTEVNTNDRMWFSQVKLGVLLQIGELRRQINHATIRRNELREKYRQLHRKCEAYKYQRQMARLPILLNSIGSDGGSGQQTVVMQPNRESSSGTRGQWIEVPQSSHNQQQMTTINALESETQQPHTTTVRIFDNRVRMQISKPGRAPVTVRLARRNSGISMPQQRRFTQLYNIADPKVIIDRNAQNPSLLSNSISSR